ncbi:hypothetical protein D3C76_1534160 [compost metagenome]
MPGEVQFDRATGFAAIRVFEGAVQVGIGQDPAPVVSQAKAGVVEFGGGGHGLHVHQRVVVFRRRMGLHAGHGHGAVIHAGHAAVVHPAHAHVIHGDQGARIQWRHQRR